MTTTGNKDKVDSHLEPVRMNRRGFVIWSALSAAAAACSRLWTDATDVPGTRRQRILEFANYPIPTYLPPGYDFFAEQDDRPDGFRDVVTQSALIYKGPRAPTSIVPSGTRFPLLFFATKEAGLKFTCTEQVDGLEYQLRSKDNGIMPAVYFDGIWEPERVYDASGKRVPGNGKLRWNRSNLHALVYEYAGFQIGIRASRLCGVQFDEMVQVASSVSLPV